VFKIKSLFNTILVLALLAPAPVMAERFADLYFGAAQGQDKDITVTSDDLSKIVKVDFENHFTMGYRMGYWSEAAPWIGIALEVSYFNQDINDLADLRIIPITPLLMLRVPLSISAEFPDGEWQPYVAGGAGFFISELKVEGTDDKDQQSDFGLDLRGGLKKYFTPNFALFVEYRYTLFTPEFDSLIKKFDLETHHALIGLTVNF